MCPQRTSEGTELASPAPIPCLFPRPLPCHVPSPISIHAQAPHPPPDCTQRTFSRVIIHHHYCCISYYAKAKVRWIPYLKMPKDNVVIQHTGCFSYCKDLSFKISYLRSCHLLFEDCVVSLNDILLQVDLQIGNQMGHVLPQLKQWSYVRFRSGAMTSPAQPAQWHTAGQVLCVRVSSTARRMSTSV
jgi:hypothetical protein